MIWQRHDGMWFWGTVQGPRIRDSERRIERHEAFISVKFFSKRSSLAVGMTVLTDKTYRKMKFPEP